MFRLTYDTNVTGPHLLTTSLAPLLLKSASPRLIFLASGTASFKLSEDDTFILNKAPEPGWPKQTFRELPAYKSSKIALNMIMRDWERLLRKDGVRVWAVNPGFLATGLGGDVEVLKKIGAGEPRLGGEILRDAVEGKYDGLQGKVISHHGKDGVQAW
jgi:NAD(P)-dependent dehydrogenase (short-subunit alcohol dehydrogenase family)